MRPGERIPVLCSDGNIRRALILRDADTFYSVPARVQVRGRTVTGFVWIDRDGAVKFTRDSWRDNAHLLPAWMP